MLGNIFIFLSQIVKGELRIEIIIFKIDIHYN